LLNFVKFLQRSARFCTPFSTFFSCPFYPIHPSCQSTSIYRQKMNMPTRRTQKNSNFPPFFKILKISFLNHVNLRNPQYRHFHRNKKLRFRVPAKVLNFSFLFIRICPASNVLVGDPVYFELSISDFTMLMV
jgi:hypothetical protein